LRTIAAAARFGDAELARLAAVAPFIVDAELAGTRVTDAGLAQLKSFTQLRRLHLERTAVEGRTLAELSELPKLMYLNLCATQVSDEALPSLASLASLRQLYLFGSRVTPAGAEALRAKMPACEIGPVAVQKEPELSPPAVQ
jgi:hypothetical protein